MSIPLSHHYHAILKLLIFQAFLTCHISRPHKTPHSLRTESSHCLSIFKVIPGIHLLVDIAANPNATDLVNDTGLQVPCFPREQADTLV